MFSRKRKRGEETRREDAGEDPETVESFAATYDHFVHNGLNAASSTSAGSNLGAPPGPGEDVGSQAERDKTTVTNLRKARSLWDRSTRDFAALVRKAGAHTRTPLGASSRRTWCWSSHRALRGILPFRVLSRPSLRARVFRREDQESGRRQQQRVEAGQGGEESGGSSPMV